MRYIKLYENFLNKDILERNIEDCLVELKDNGFNIETTIYNSYVNIEIDKNNQEFELYDIKEYIIQLVDYMNEKYINLEIMYVPETRFKNDSYSNLDDITSEYLDMICFNIFFKWVYSDDEVTSLIENHQEQDKDWGVGKYNDGFVSGNLKDLKKRVENIFVELVDNGYIIDVDITFMSIAVSIKLNNNNLSFEESKYIDSELVKDYAETFIEYIRERNKNIDSELGLGVRYELNQGQNAMHRKYIYDDFLKNEHNITDLKIVLGV